MRVSEGSRAGAEPRNVGLRLENILTVRASLTAAAEIAINPKVPKQIRPNLGKKYSPIDDPILVTKYIEKATWTSRPETRAPVKPYADVPKTGITPVPSQAMAFAAENQGEPFGMDTLRTLGFPVSMSSSQRKASSLGPPEWPMRNISVP
ncbi:unnamed protein product, partial [Mesorhabditis spiculigera]